MTSFTYLDWFRLLLDKTYRYHFLAYETVFFFRCVVIPILYMTYNTGFRFAVKQILHCKRQRNTNANVTTIEMGGNLIFGHRLELFYGFFLNNCFKLLTYMYAFFPSFPKYSIHDLLPLNSFILNFQLICIY